MNNLKIIYFYEEGKIYPFLNEETKGNEEYYAIKKLKSITTEENNLLLKIKIKRYINFLNKGYSYQEIKDTLNQAKEKVLYKRNIAGINEIFEDKEALDIAADIYNTNKIKKKKLTSLYSQVFFFFINI